MLASVGAESGYGGVKKKTDKKDFTDSERGSGRFICREELCLEDVKVINRRERERGREIRRADWTGKGFMYVVNLLCNGSSSGGAERKTAKR